ncbi:ABC transporter substrate-binding protein [Nocardia sp. CA2R105]|uniref:ABC transporter substrate-binding protein n=1 Tax=Nocardia coffeae TaxID=2873381 RepID=UPI001CA64BF6|nr:ABC transporter substrate-binding protein [Nocardia coffeae]MBY8855140.1 ABC transporter substrate-binding protein [Nocardia coffeae]
MPLPIRRSRPPVRRSRPRRCGAVVGALTAAIAAMLLVTGCGSGPGGSDRRETLVVAYRNEVTTLDPVRADYQESDNVEAVLYDTLIGYDHGRMVPQLATEFAYSPDVTSVQLTLRPGVKFHSGNPLTARDVVYSLDRVKSIGQGIIGQISSYKSATAIDDTHLTIALTHPDALFMGALSRIYIVDSTLLTARAGSDQGQNWLLNHDAGSGPYRLQSSSAGTIQTTRYDSFWAFDPKRPRNLTFRRIDDQATIRDEIKAGNADLGWISKADAKSFQGIPSVTVGPAPDAYQMVIYFNTAQGPGANPALREALRYVLDYRGALDSIYNGQGTIANGPLPTNLTCRPELPTERTDLAKAKQILSAAGLAGTTLTMRYQPTFSEHTKAATLLQSNLKEIGITLQLQPIAFADYLTMLSDPKTIPDMILLGENAPYPDPGVMITKTFWSKSVGTNRGAYSNPAVDALIEQATNTPDADARCGLYSQAQRLIDADFATMPLYTVHNTWAWRSDVRGMDVAAPGGGVGYRALTVGN